VLFSLTPCKQVSCELFFYMFDEGFLSKYLDVVSF
jgi:hypothetical protein